IRLSEHKVSFGHWAFLRILWERDGLTQRQLSERAGVMEPTTFTALKAMERLGYVVRRRVSGGGKKAYIFLTPKGRLIKNRLVPLAEAVNAAAVRDISAADVDTTRKVLLAIIDNLARDEEVREARMPSTRALARIRNGRNARRSIGVR